MTKDEQRACRAIARAAADHIVDDWGEPLKDVEVPDSIDGKRLEKLSKFVAAKIRKLSFKEEV